MTLPMSFFLTQSHFPVIICIANYFVSVIAHTKHKRAIIVFKLAESDSGIVEKNTL